MALTCSEPGPWQLSQSNLPGWDLPIRPISVLPNDAACSAWHPRQVFEPTKWPKTTGATYAGGACLGCFGAARGAVFGFDLEAGSGTEFGVVFGTGSCGACLPNNSRRASKALSASAILSCGALDEPESSIPICCA